MAVTIGVSTAVLLLLDYLNAKLISPTIPRYFSMYFPDKSCSFHGINTSSDPPSVRRLVELTHRRTPKMAQYLLRLKVNESDLARFANGEIDFVRWSPSRRKLDVVSLAAWLAKAGEIPVLEDSA